MKNNWYVLAVGAAALVLNASTGSGQVFNSFDVLNNRAVAASPRAKEEFPWLTRSAAPTAVKTVATDRAKNRAIAASPRMLEQFPELARPAQPLKAESGVAATVIKNRALAASPRAREEFPWLARGNYTVTAEPFQIAPLK